MDRRSFFRRVFGAVAGAALAKALPSTSAQPMLASAVPTGFTCLNDDGFAYRMVRAWDDLKEGDLVVLAHHGDVLGVATCDIDHGNCGFVQVSGVFDRAALQSPRF